MFNHGFKFQKSWSKSLSITSAFTFLISLVSIQPYVVGKMNFPQGRNHWVKLNGLCVLSRGQTRLVQWSFVALNSHANENIYISIVVAEYSEHLFHPEVTPLRSLGREKRKKRNCSKLPNFCNSPLRHPRANLKQPSLLWGFLSCTS